MLKYTELGRVEHDKLYFLMHGDLMCKRQTEKCTNELFTNDP